MAKALTSIATITRLILERWWQYIQSDYFNISITHYSNTQQNQWLNVGHRSGLSFLSHPEKYFFYLRPFYRKHKKTLSRLHRDKAF